MAEAIALHTGGTTLKWGTSSSTYDNEIKVKSIGDLGGEPATIDVTDLSQTKMKVYIAGLQDLSSITCTANYTPEAYEKTLTADDGTVKYIQILLGGNGGAFEFQGTIKAWKNAVEVDAAQEYSIALTPQTEITFNKTPS